MGSVADAFLRIRSRLVLQSGAPLLQFGADKVLQITLGVIYTGLIKLAEQAERYLMHAHMTEQIAAQWAASIEARDIGD